MLNELETMMAVDVLPRNIAFRCTIAIFHSLTITTNTKLMILCNDGAWAFITHDQIYLTNHLKDRRRHISFTHIHDRIKKSAFTLRMSVRKHAPCSIQQASRTWNPNIMQKWASLTAQSEFNNQFFAHQIEMCVLDTTATNRAIPASRHKLAAG